MFLMILSWSRHRFVRFVFRMDASTWIDCHVRAFQLFAAFQRRSTRSSTDCLRKSHASRGRHLAVNLKKKTGVWHNPGLKEDLMHDQQLLVLYLPVKNDGLI